MFYNPIDEMYHLFTVISVLAFFFGLSLGRLLGVFIGALSLQGLDVDDE